MNEIKDEEFSIEDNILTITYKAKGDIGFIKELQYMKFQAIVDRMVGEINV